MAKVRLDDEHVEKPRPDVYLAIMILTVSSMLIATVLMFLEYYALQ